MVRKVGAQWLHDATGCHEAHVNSSMDVFPLDEMLCELLSSSSFILFLFLYYFALSVFFSLLFICLFLLIVACLSFSHLHLVSSCGSQFLHWLFVCLFPVP